MRTKIEYPWYLRTWFIVLLAALFWLIVPIPIMIFLLVRRLEYRQLCRLIIAKLLSIDFYMEEISELEGRKQTERFKRSFEIKEAEYQELNTLQEELHRDYDLLVFRKVLKEKIKADPFRQPNVQAIPNAFEETIIDTIQVDVANEKRAIKDKVEKRRQAEDLEERQKIKERKRAKRVRKLREERKIAIESDNRAGEVPFFREASQPVAPEEKVTFEEEAYNVADDWDATPEPASEAPFPVEPSTREEEAVSTPVVPEPEREEAPEEEAVETTKPKTPAKPKEEAKIKEPKKERVRPVMQGNRVYLSFDDFDDEF